MGSKSLDMKYIDHCNLFSSTKVCSISISIPISFVGDSKFENFQYLWSVLSISLVGLQWIMGAIALVWDW